MRRTLFGPLAALTTLGVVMLVSAVATAAPTSITFIAPSPAEGSTLTTNATSFAFTYPKKPNATRSLVCTLAGPTASTGACNAPVADGSKGAKSGKSYTGLQNGSYTLTVSLTLTDGGTATGTRHFTINVPPPGHVYWANLNIGDVGRANLDGTNANQSFIVSNGAHDVAVNASHVYWNGFNPGTISRANLDGTGATALVTPAGVNKAIEIDGNYLYWAAGDVGAWSIGRSNLDGTGATSSFINLGDNGPDGLAVDGTYIYWMGNNAIGRAKLDGTDVNHSFIPVTGVGSGVAVDGTYIYWARGNGDTIARAKLDGTDVNESFVALQSGSLPRGVAVSASHIYWSAQVSGRIGRANLDGTGVNQLLVTGASSPIGVAVGAG